MQRTSDEMVNIRKGFADTNGVQQYYYSVRVPSTRRTEGGKAEFCIRVQHIMATMRSRRSGIGNTISDRRERRHVDGGSVPRPVDATRHGIRSSPFYANRNFVTGEHPCTVANESASPGSLLQLLKQETVNGNDV